MVQDRAIITEENLVHMDRLRDDNVQEILGSIGPFLAKLGAPASKKNFRSAAPPRSGLI